MRCTIPAVALVVVLAAGVLAAGPVLPVGPVPADLVKKLGSPEYQAREAATKSLDTLGEAALPALAKALAESSDRELIERAEDLYLRISRRIENAQLIAPTLIELNLADVTVAAALETVEKQSGYKFYLPTDVAPAVRVKKITVQTKGKVPFWEAMDKVCEAAGIRVVGTGLPVADPRTLARIEPLGGRVAFPAQPLLPGAAVPAQAGFPGAMPPVQGFVPVVPPAPPDPKAAEEAKQKAEAKQAAAEKAARDIAAAKDLQAWIEKRAEDAIQQKGVAKPDEKKPEAKPGEKKAEAKPAPPPPVAVPPPVQLQKAQLQAIQLQALAQAQQAQQAELLAKIAALEEARGGYSRSTITPANSFAIMLAPQPARTPASVGTAIKVEALPNVADYRGGQPPDTLLVLLQATPEPRVALERVTEVRLTRALTEDNQELFANKLSQPINTNRVTTVMVGGVGGQAQVIQRRVILANGEVMDGMYMSSQPSLRQGLLRIMVPKSGPVTKINELTGVLVGMVRTPPSEVVAVPDLYPAGPALTYRGQEGTTLKATVTDENIDNTYSLDVVLAYSYTRVTAAVPGRDEAIISEKLGKVAPVRPQPALQAAAARIAPSRVSNVMYTGLVLTDDEGKPFRLMAQTARTSSVLQNGERIYVRTMRLTATPTEDGQGKPTKLAFYGTWQKPVEVPFTLKDVPVATGLLKSN